MNKLAHSCLPQEGQEMTALRLVHQKKLWPTCFCWYLIRMYYLLDKTHVVVKGRTHQVSTKVCQERRYFIGQGLTDLLYANAKDLIQSRRVYIRVASLSLISFCHLSVFSLGQLISYINLYQLFTEHYTILFSLQFRVGWVSSLEVKYGIFRYRDEGTWTWLSILPRTGFSNEVCSSLSFS